LESIAVEALKTPWTFFLTQHINEETLRKYQQELQSAKDAARAMKMYLTNLQKTGLAVQPGTEVIARDGYTMTTAQLQELQSLVDDERNVSAAVSAARRAVSNKGRGRGRARGSGTTSAVQSENVNSTVAPLHQSETRVGQVNMMTGKRNSIGARGRGDTRSRGAIVARVQQSHCCPLIQSVRDVVFNYVRITAMKLQGQLFAMNVPSKTDIFVFVPYTFHI
jgi:hypothetical protein